MLSAEARGVPQSPKFLAAGITGWVSRTHSAVWSSYLDRS
jgi:hypothetical protein